LSSSGLHQPIQRGPNTGRKRLTTESGARRGCQCVRIALRRSEETGDGVWELVLRYKRPKLAVTESVRGARNAEAKCRCAARHRLQECDAETFPGRRHDEQVGHAVELDKSLQPNAAEETHTLAHPSITRKRFEADSIDTLPDDQITDVMALRDKVRNCGDHAVVALVALARVHPTDSQENALPLER
jgi:hypothetical protein